MLRALSFLTIVGRGAAPDGRTLRWFPLIGLLLGAAVGGVWWAAGEVLPPMVGAGVVVAFDLVLTGMLHMDGLADSADGLLPHLDRKRRLAIMADSTVGAFAVTVLVLVLLLRVGALASRPASVLLVAGLWTASRSMLALTASTGTYARTGGLAAPLLGDRFAPVAGVVGIIAGTGLAAWGAGAAGFISVIALLLTAGLVVWFAGRRIGGFTGDVLGAMAVLGETVGLVVATARW